MLLRLSPKSKNEVVATTFLTSSVFYFILENRENFPKNKLTLAMKALKALNIKWLPIEDGDLLEDAALLAEEYDVDFDDAINALIMQRNGIKEIYALDPDYDKFDDISRIVPE